MPVRRVTATVESTVSKMTTCGIVHRKHVRDFDVTGDIFRLPLAQLHKLRDESKMVIRLARSLVGPDHEVDCVSLVESVKDCVGVSRLTDITEDDLRLCRCTFGIARPRTRTLPT